MYIEFRLPQGAGRETAYYALAVIQNEITKWLEQHSLPCKQKTIKYTHRLTFDDDHYYTLFALTWNPKNREQYPSWLTYYMIEPMKVDTN